MRHSDFIAAIRLQGASSVRIIWGHIVPLCTSSLIVRLTLDMAGIILTAAGLGFLGLGAQPPLPEWGAMISTGRQYLLEQWWVATMPGIAILIVSLGFDTFHADPICNLALETDDYARIGSAIAALGVPVVAVQEGGYAVEALGANAVAFLDALRPSDPEA